MKILFSQELIYEEREREREISTTLNCSEKGVSFSIIFRYTVAIELKEGRFTINRIMSSFSSI